MATNARANEKEHTSKSSKNAAKNDSILSPDLRVVDIVLPV